MPKTKNSEALSSFTAYCTAHPDERFWQALRNWSGWPFILVSTDIDYGAGPFKPPSFKDPHDTFYWEGLPKPADSLRKEEQAK